MNKSIIKLIIGIIIITFIASYLVASTGYYEYTMQQRTVLTNDKIKQFEQDIKDNKEIDLNTYYEATEMDYSNKFTTLVYNISESSNELAKKAIKSLFKKLSILIED